ncbi:pentapeptide repeat-containing protein [Gordonia sp. TBRC 11910]|uniref:Pentapeptide repeat-containing protein n=1 Tax=Gordonia asplenii TaxID=2725283 RepID=A0A848KXF4_9ACTN|nr:pentapeptide repeat-containing protein [Gordonia asplenii]NMO02922.1 pentapeptide repeat-containing protein [Gordonia asplenii]
MSTPVSGVDLEYREFDGVDLRGTDLQSARMRGTRLQDVDLRGADLRGADLRGALAMWSSTCIRGARLDGCDLRDADFSGVDAREVSLEGANLEGSRWDGADLRGARLSRARFGWQSIWLADLAAGRDRRQPASFDDALLVEATLTEAHLPGVSMRRADLRSVSAARAVLTGAQLCGANLRDADLDGADLCEADLRDAALSSARLRGAALLGARLFGTELTGAALDEARLGQTAVHAIDSADMSVRDITHLAPNFTDDTVPPPMAGPQPCGTSCLLVDGTPGSRATTRVVDGLTRLGLHPYPVAPDALISPAGPMVAVRAAQSHPITVAVTRRNRRDPSWIPALHRAAIDTPLWNPHLVIVLDSDDDGHIGIRGCTGTAPAGLGDVVDRLTTALRTDADH